MTTERMAYHADPAVGSSALACVLRSAREYQQAFVERTLATSETDAMRFGTLVHLRVLEPEKYRSIVTRIPPDVLSKSGSRAGAAWKEWQFEQHAAGRMIVTDSEADRIEGIYESIGATPIARWILDQVTAVEQPLRWTDAATGVECKGLMDAVLPGVIVDVKTTTDVSWEGFRRRVISSSYHVQAAHYLDGYPQADQWWWLACQTQPPYLVRAYSAEADMIERGQTLRLVALERIKRGQTMGDWADREEREIIPLTLPNWERLPVETEAVE
jgi:hypothetical protein